MTNGHDRHNFFGMDRGGAVSLQRKLASWKTHTIRSTTTAHRVTIIAVVVVVGMVVVAVVIAFVTASALRF